MHEDIEKKKETEDSVSVLLNSQCVKSYSWEDSTFHTAIG